MQFNFFFSNGTKDREINKNGNEIFYYFFYYRIVEKSLPFIVKVGPPKILLIKKISAKRTLWRVAIFSRVENFQIVFNSQWINSYDNKYSNTTCSTTKWNKGKEENISFLGNNVLNSLNVVAVMSTTDRLQSAFHYFLKQTPFLRGLTSLLRSFLLRSFDRTRFFSTKI